MEGSSNAAAAGAAGQGGLAARGLDMEAARLSQLREALAQKRAQPSPRKPSSRLSGLKNAMLGGFEESAPMEADDEGAVSGGAEELAARGEQMARQAAMAERLASLKQMAATKKDELLQSKEGQEARKKFQKEIRKGATNAIRRGVEFLLDSIAGCVDTGTVGVSLIVDIFIYAFTLTDLNIQMIYGYYIAKDKSLLFPALDWSPLRIPLPVIFLHAGLVFFDLFLIFVIGFLFLFTIVAIFWPILIAAGGFAALTTIGYTLFTDPTFAAAVVAAAKNALQ